MQPNNAAVAESDEQLACRAQQGCTDSFEELVRRFQVPLLQFLQQRTSPADAEDLLQDTFIRAYQNLDRYRPTWRLATWLYTIARRLSINHYRRRRAAADSRGLESVPAAGASPAEAVADEEGRRRLWDRAAEVLSEPQMTAVWLYYVEDMPVKEIAAVEGRSRMAVKTMLFRARKRLLPALEEFRPQLPANGRNTTPNNSSRPKAAEVTNG